MVEMSKGAERQPVDADGGPELAVDRQGRAENHRASRAVVARFLVFLVAIAAWQVLAELNILDQDYVSKPSSIVAAVLHLVQDIEAVRATQETLVTVGMAFVIGTSAGLLAGILIGLQSLIREAYLPVVMIMLGTPKSVLLPVFVALFGLGGGSALAFGVVLAFVHVTVNVVGGVDLIERRHLTVAYAYRASPIKRLVHVILPAASPGIFTSLWHGLRNAFLGVVIGELFAGSSGIGRLVRVYTNNFQTAEALALVLVISTAVILVGTAWNHLERRLTRWQTDGTAA